MTEPSNNTRARSMQRTPRSILWPALLGLLLPAMMHVALADSPPAPLAKATFAGGCFWCMEPPYDELEGVLTTTSGYTGGHTENPTYEEVSAGTTGHAEAVQILYDPGKITYADLLKVFWRNIDPTTPDRQFCDKGSQYRTVIFYHDEEQKLAVEESKRELERTKPFGEPIVTEIVPAAEFFPAEPYHQDFYQKNPIRFKLYKFACGRDQRLEALWGRR